MGHNNLSPKNISVNLLVYGTAHAIIDGICAGVIFSIYNGQIIGTTSLIYLVILYNALAFGLQALFGLVSDYFESPRLFAALGCMLTGISAIAYLSMPIVAIVLAGMGNALFHVGAGSIILNLTPKRAFASGIFVAPGALGLLAGVLLGKYGYFIPLPFILALAFLCSLMLIIKKPILNYDRKKAPNNSYTFFEYILFLLLSSIAIRSLIGSILIFPWKKEIDLLIILTVGIALGKGIGGILADKFGWSTVAVSSLILSVPFLVFGSNIPLMAIFGMFLFNMTMPITLVAVSNILPGRPGFAFGLNCLALFLGVFPTYLGIKLPVDTQWLIFIIITASIVALYFGLKKYLMLYEQKQMVD